jgi:hypothetical protein
MLAGVSKASAIVCVLGTKALKNLVSDHDPNDRIKREEERTCMDRMIAYCGLVCTDCEAYIATQANDLMERGAVNCAHCDDYACEKLEGFFGMAPNARVTLDGIRAGMLA